MGKLTTIPFGKSVAAVLFFMALISCQRQLHFDETPADGTLAQDVSGNCKPVIVGGAFIKNKQLADTNFITVEVNVTEEGSYAIHTDTINGYWFSASGNFDHRGRIAVKMRAHGKPVNVGENQFTIRFSTGICYAKVAVTEGGAASFSFQGAPDRCRNAVVLGEYIKGVQLNSSNVAKVQVYVTSPGYYSFSSNVVNGYQFSSSGYLPNYGNETLTLTASGSPANAGVDVFTLNAGFSSCTIVDTVKDAQHAFPFNHFPLTLASTWTYNDLQYPADSVKRIVIDSAAVNGTWYKNFEHTDISGTTKLQFRRSGDDYFEYGRADKYTSALAFSPVINAEIHFLKEQLATGDTWASVVYTGTTLTGEAYSLRYSFVCTNHDATVMINGHTFQHVYKIEVRPLTARPSATLTDTGEVYEYYYANQIGLIYFRKTSNGVTTIEGSIRRWQVN